MSDKDEEEKGSKEEKSNIEDEIKNEKEKEKEEKKLNKSYKERLESLKKQCCKELKVLNSKLDKAQKHKKGYYELFIIENDINIQLELIERNIKNDEEKSRHDILKNEFLELKKELARIRGENFD